MLAHFYEAVWWRHLLYTLDGHPHIARDMGLEGTGMSMTITLTGTVSLAGIPIAEASQESLKRGCKHGMTGRHWLL